MKSTFIAMAFALASSAFAAPSSGKGFCLTNQQATTIVNKYKSILEGAQYNGQSPNVTANQIVASNYTEYSNSILSLEQSPLGNNTPSATSRQQWLSEVLAYPDSGIETLDVLHSCNKIMWHWLFPNVGSGKYEVKGFNLLTVNTHAKIIEAQLEFDSIAWGLDTQQLYEWCPSSGSSGSSSSSAAATASTTAARSSSPATSSSAAATTTSAAATSSSAAASS